MQAESANAPARPGYTAPAAAPSTGKAARLPPHDIDSPDVETVDALTKLVVRAASKIESIGHAGVTQRMKPDGSPVTAADEASEAIILNGLARILPNVPVISEERGDRPELSPGDRFVLLDPLDGTREFLAGRDEYAINLAIVSAGVPVLGIIAAPARGLLWRGFAEVAERLRMSGDDLRRPERIRTRRWPQRGAVALISRSHFDAETDALLARLPQAVREASGSSLKFCRIAEGSADVYPRLGTTSEWDIAAGHALVVAAGGCMAEPSGAALTYGRADRQFRSPSFIAWGDPAMSRPAA
jgi:3'(2'), 5'-bisphosphate nucleotidase